MLAAAMASQIDRVTKALPECGSTAAAAAPVQHAGCITCRTAHGTGAAAYQWDPAGPGTQLKKLLAKVGIKHRELQL
jgi:hypothetical protein